MIDGLGFGILRDGAAQDDASIWQNRAARLWTLAGGGFGSEWTSAVFAKPKLDRGSRGCAGQIPFR